MALTALGKGSLNSNSTSTSTFNMSSLTGMDGTGTVTLAQNDVVFVNIVHGYTATRTLAQVTPTGYTSVNGSVLTSSDTDVTSMGVFYKVMGATPDTTITIPACAATTASIVAQILVVRGLNTDSFNIVTPTTATGINGALANPPSVTTASNPSGCYVIGFMGAAMASGAVFGAPTTTAYDATSGFFTSVVNTAGTNDAVSAFGIKSGLGTSTAFDASACTNANSANTSSWCALSLVAVPVQNLTQTISNASTPSFSVTELMSYTKTASISSTLVSSLAHALSVPKTASISNTPSYSLTHTAQKRIGQQLPGNPVPITSASPNKFSFTDALNGAGWGKTACTIATGQSDPFGGTAAFGMKANNATNANVRINQSQSVYETHTYTQSIYAKAGASNFLRMGIGDQNIQANQVITYFDLSSGTVGTVGANASAAITSVGSGWYRCSVTMSFNFQHTTVGPDFGPADADNSTQCVGDGTTISIYVYGPQTNEGSTPFAYFVNSGSVGSTSGIACGLYGATLSGSITGGTPSQTISNAMTPAFSVVRSTGKIFSIASTLGFAVTKTVATALKISSTALYAIGRVISPTGTNIATTPAYSMSHLPTYDKKFTGSSTPSFSLVRAMGAIRSIAVTPVFSRVLSAAHIVTNAMTPTYSMVRAFSGRVTAIASTPGSAILKSTTHTFSIASTWVGTIAKLLTQKAAITSTPTSVIIKATTKAVVIASTPVVTVIRQTVKALTIATTDIGTVIATKVNLLTASIATTPATAIVRSTAKLVNIASTPALTIVRAMTKIIIGAITPAPAIIKQATRALAIASTPTAFITKQLLRALSIASTPGFLVIKSTGKIISTAMTPSVLLSFVASLFRTFAAATTASFSMAKTTAISKLASTTPVATLSAIKVLLSTFTATANTTASVIRSTATKLLAASTPAITLAHNAAKVVLAVVTPLFSRVVSIAISRTIASTPVRSLSGQIVLLVNKTIASTPAATVVRSTAKIISLAMTPVVTLNYIVSRLVKLVASTTPAFSVVRAMTKLLSIASTPAATLRGILVFLRANTAAITPAATVLHNVQKVILAAMTPSIIIVRSIARAISSTMTPSALLRSGFNVARAFGAVITPSATVVRAATFQKAAAIAVNLTTTVGRSVIHIVAASATSASKLTVTVGHLVYATGNTVAAVKKTTFATLSMAVDTIANIARRAITNTHKTIVRFFTVG